MTWKFSIPKVPWCVCVCVCVCVYVGGQLERLIDLTKHNLYKSIGRSQLTYNKLEEILLDVEINFNNRPLTYTEDNIQLNTLTPSNIILGRDVRTINSNADGDLNK